MIYIKSILDNQLASNPPSNPDRFKFIDIETTGLSSKHNQIYLIGTAYFDESVGNWIIEQFFSENPGQEPEILRAFKNNLAENSVASTYNGDTFDIPFISSRMAKYGISPSIFQSQDIYKFLKSNSVFFQLQNYKLKTVEMELGIYREDIYSGKDCIKFYNEYTRTRSKELLRIILRHNFDDLASMPSLLKLYDKVNQNKTIHVPIIGNQTQFFVESVKEVGDLITLSGNANPAPYRAIKHFLANSSIEISNDGKFKIAYELIKAIGTDSIPVSVIDAAALGIGKSNYHMNTMKVPEGFVLIKSGKDLMIENLKNIVAEHLKSIFN